MKKELLIFIITILLSSIARADDAPPALPQGEMINTQGSVVEENQPKLSLWEKFKNFLGFGSKEEALEPNITKEVASEAPPPLPDLPSLESSAPKDSNLPEKQEIAEQNNTSKQPDQAGEYTPVDLKKADNTEPLQDQKDENLKLPEGFEEFKDNSDSGPLAKEETKPINLSDAPASENADEPSKTVGQPVKLIPQEASLPEKIEPQEQEKAQEMEQKLVSETPSYKGEVTTDSTAKEEQKLPSEQQANLPNIAQTPVTPEAHKLPVDQNSPVAKFRNHLRDRPAKIASLPEIPKNEVALDSAIAAERNQVEKFVSNEAKVLILPNDDVVLGEVTDDTKLELMDFSNYVNIFWDNYNEIKDSPKRQIIDDFLSHYDENFNQEKFTAPNNTELKAAFSEAKRAIASGNINNLHVLLDYYPILQLKDKQGENLLDEAVKLGNYPATKLLIMHGIQIQHGDTNTENVFYIAQKYNRSHIIYLLNSATKGKLD